jgi:opacity protein-like surface antigen
MVRSALIASVAAFALGPVATASAADIGEVVDYPASWNSTFSIELIYATRTAGKDSVIIEDTVTGDPVLTSNDFRFGWAPGVDARINVDNNGTDIGLRFLGLLNFSGTAAVTTPAIWNFPTDPALFGLGVADVASTINTSFNSLEVNFSHPQWQGFFAGLRLVALNDKMVNDADFGGSEAVITTQANSIGIGPQIGGEARFGDQMFVNVDGRVGALLTQSNLSFDVEQAIGPAFGASGNPTGIAGIAELGVAAGMQLGPQSAVKLGYRVVYLHNFPTAPASILGVDVLSETMSRQSDSFFIHGVTLGLEVVY